MVIIPPGEFLMGDDRDEDSRPRHTVRIAKKFAMGRYPITFDEYDKFASATSRDLPDDNRWGRGRQPVINVRWNDAAEYARWVSEQSGKRYRLPSEAEWEYAARAGTTTAYWWGEEINPKLANFRGADNQWGGKQTSPVGSFEANPFGLFDTTGNVWQWVADCWHKDYSGAPADGSAWLEAGGGDCGQRVLRGGCWSYFPVSLRASFRIWIYAGVRDFAIGFRLARDVD